MTEYVHLIGAEDVRTASNRIQQSAHEISSAASSIDNSRDMFFRQLNECIDRFESLVKRLEDLASECEP